MTLWHYVMNSAIRTPISWFSADSGCNLICWSMCLARSEFTLTFRSWASGQHLKIGGVYEWNAIALLGSGCCFRSSKVGHLTQRVMHHDHRQSCYAQRFLYRCVRMCPSDHSPKQAGARVDDVLCKCHVRICGDCYWTGSPHLQQLCPLRWGDFNACDIMMAKVETFYQLCNLDSIIGQEIMIICFKSINEGLLVI